MDDRHTPVAGGLHDAGIEHDSCGFGLIADIAGPGSRAIVDTALEALSRMEHRGGVAADGLSGDGCGVLLHGCEAFVRALADDVFQDEHGIPLGTRVTIAAESFGTEPTEGDLIAATRTRYTLRRTDPRAGTVHVHFPRIGYVLRAVAS